MINANYTLPIRVCKLVSNAQERLRICKVPEKDIRHISIVLEEWYATTTIGTLLERWEKVGEDANRTQNVQNNALSFCLFNVQGWGSRSLEVLDLIHQAQASFIVCTEVGEQWSSFRLPEFNMFHEKGTNKCGGVTVGVGKHLQASKVAANIPNTEGHDIKG
jgi:hypothetical protein